MSSKESGTTTEASAAALAPPVRPKKVEETEDTITTPATDSYGYTYLDDLDLPPLRIHATNRLSSPNLQAPGGVNHMTKRYSLDSKVAHLSTASGTGSPTAGSAGSSLASYRGRSRSRSPSIRSSVKDRATTTTQDGNSSFSSLEEFVDPDILYDTRGIVELDIKEQKKQQQLLHQHSHSYTFGENIQRAINLTPVTERMSEDTLEDVHAFSDLSANTNTRPSSSAGGSTVGGSTVGGEVSSHVLDPLEEVNEDDISSEEGDLEHPHHSTHNGDGGSPQGPTPQVIVTNMENITLQDNLSMAETEDTDAVGNKQESEPRC